MSHFTVLVITDEPGMDAVKKALAPYQENNMGDCPPEYMEFNSVRNEYDYETALISQIRLSSGEYFYRYDEIFKQIKKGDGVFASYDYVYPEGSEEVERPASEIMSEKEYYEEYCGYKWDESQKDYGYWENPNAKWDWYQVGGRWAGYFTVKKSAIANHDFSIGSPGLMGSNRGRDADHVQMKNIDFDAMAEADRKEANKCYDEFLNEIDNYRALYPAYEGSDEDIPERCAFMWGIEKGSGIGGLETREEYLARREANGFSTFAVIKDGEWYERGSMGWWAMVSDEDDNWNSKFMQLIRGLNPDTWLTVVDCHI